MNQFSYLFGLASVVALPISDLTISLNRLLTMNAKVRWDWLAPLAAMVAFLKIITQWWGWFSAISVASNITFFMFMWVLISTMLLYLMVAEALPDAIGDDGVDLRAYYDSVSRRFWLLFATNWILAVATGDWIENVVVQVKVSMGSLVLLVVPVAILLAFVRNRFLHTFCLVGFVTYYLVRS